jgi:hypothetical protein
MMRIMVQSIYQNASEKLDQGDKYVQGIPDTLLLVAGAVGAPPPALAQKCDVSDFAIEGFAPKVF